MLRRPRLDDRRRFLLAVRASRALHGVWVQPPATPAAYGEFLRRARARDRRTFLVARRDTGAFAGVVNVNNIVDGAFSNASLGYYGFAGAIGEGTMTAAVRLAVTWCFTERGLHRVEANIQPGNARSRALIERLGFRHEGFSPSLLLIAGVWCDHDRFAITAEEWCVDRGRVATSLDAPPGR